MKKALIYSFCTALVFTCSTVLAQIQKGIDTIEVNVVTRYKPVINDAAKVTVNPAPADTVKLTKKVSYNTLTSQFPTSYVPRELSAIQLKREPLDPLTHSLLNVGGGNYNTAYAEYFFNALRSRDEDYGIHLNHLSSQATLTNEGFSGYSYNDVNMYYKKLFDGYSVYAAGNFDNHVVHDYGYDITKENISNNDSTRQRYDLFGGTLKYESEYKDSTRINNAVELNYSNFSNLSPTTENNFKGDFWLNKYFGEQRLDVRGGVEFYSDRTLLTNSNTTDLFINPFFTANEKRWDAHLGLSGYYVPGANQSHLYPDLSARFHIVQDIIMFYAGIDGKQYYNGYKALSDVNPFLQDTVENRYTLVLYHAFGGLAGTLTPELTYNVSASQSQFKDMPLFITDTLVPLRNQFAVVYDDVEEMNVHLDLGYKINDALNISLAGDYFGYTAKNQLEVWYHPGIKINLEGRYTIQQKCTIRLDLFYLGSQYAPQYTDGVESAKTLDGYPDFNLGADYKISKMFTVFLNLNNIANITYYQWDNYPLQKFNVLGGLRVGF